MLLILLQQAITTALLSSPIALFLCFCYSKGEILGLYGYLIRKLPTWIANPLGDCVYCHSTWVTLFVCYVLGVHIYVVPFALGWNYVLVGIFQKWGV